ncbi:zf-TFIIB domain-containing protein [Nocardioides sp.]|uniref:TFIIB-type zinc ribbon-containing protein n=1 Tax=Nocardioides sp. TaxID=35761 RepID=UPI00286AC06C|nr:zf-TFIIB domain-containing protein [Nocardioides sp.]
MQCPTDATTLVMSERSGIEIDYCPTCRGVWLDRGELDKIIDRSMSLQPPAAAPAAPPQQSYDRDDRDRSRDQDGRYETYQQPRQQGSQQGYPQQGHYKKKRKESWLSEIFD